MQKLLGWVYFNFAGICHLVTQKFFFSTVSMSTPVPTIPEKSKSNVEKEIYCIF